jgi:glycosyltransferase involved in cell wall biosynthesis
MSKIDVIVPCYLYGRYLRVCVESILSQSLSDNRVLIVDDASPDHTPEVANELVRSDRRVEYIRHATNRGHIATYNDGLEWISAEYALLLSADDYLLPGAFERAVRLMDAHPEVVMTHGEAILLYEGDLAPQFIEKKPGEQGARNWSIVEGADFIAQALEGNRIVTATAVVRTRVQKRIGGYRADLPHAGDMEMWFRFASQGAIGEILTPQAVYRKHADAMSVGYTLRTGDIEQRKLIFDILFDTYGSNLPNHEQLRRRGMMLLAKDAAHFAGQFYNRGDMESCKELCDMARALSPDIVKSGNWQRLRMKRLIGYSLWAAVRPWINRLRGIK